jgi:SAM-dependent methyltransferase
MSNDYNWPLYFEKTQNGKPRENLVRALDLFARENFHGLCMDIGSGAGNDISYLLDKGWKVIAFDPEEDSQRIIHERFPSHPNLNFTKASFKEISWEMVDLINCSYVLPFCEKDYFDTLMQNIITHVKPGGRFAGNFFGPRHGWNHLNLVSKEKALSYFSNFNIEYIHEVEEDKISALDEEIFFHNIDLVARKRS